MNILAVDDEQTALQALLGAIEKAAPDAQLIGFTKPKEALEYARQNKVDVAFLDMRMAELDGLFLAEKLKEQNPKINIIPVTGHAEYALDAFRVRVSGFLQKPVTADAVKFELSVLRHPPEDTNTPRVRIQCFGSFGVFVHGKPLLFTREKAKELLAFLVYHQGAAVSISAIVAALWEDKANTPEVQSNVRNVISRLLKALRDAGIDDIILKERNSIAVDVKEISCDYYDYLQDREKYAHTFHGEFLNEYSWAEPTLAVLEEKGKQKI